MSWAHPMDMLLVVGIKWSLRMELHHQGLIILSDTLLLISLASTQRLTRKEMRAVVGKHHAPQVPHKFFLGA